MDKQKHDFKNFEAALAYLEERWGKENVKWQDFYYGLMRGVLVKFPNDRSFSVKYPQYHDHRDIVEINGTVRDFEDRWDKFLEESNETN